ncbi:MAG: glycosyltransferase [Solirubrobacterales bacterium]|nr:glycosyltransferase [Solirubrobacterales bacterium]
MTLVMPVWRPREQWLREAVDGALGQRDCEHEVIVVDDGCDRPVSDLLADVIDPRLRIVRVPHGGVCAARDTGLAEARGQWIRYIDADDVLEPGSTARLLRAVRGREDLIAYGATAMCDEELTLKWVLRCRLEGDIAKQCLLGRFTVRLPALLFPRAVAERVGRWDPTFRVAEDWDFVLRALDHAEVRRDPGVAAYYRRHGDGLTGDPTAGPRDLERLVERHLDRHPELAGTPLERRIRGMRHAVSSRIHLGRGHPRRAARDLLAALAADPRAVSAEARQSLPGLPSRLRRK